MGKEEIIKIAKKFSESAIYVLDVEKIFLYGSFAKGTYRKDSDIDIALVVKNDKYNYFKSYSKLSEICRNVDTRIEPIILEKGNDPSGFLENIYKEGIVVYSKN
jgi:uncharacterized protein